MSDPAIALGGAQAQAGIARIDDLPLQGMLGLRGQLADPAFSGAVAAATGVEIPTPRQTRTAGDLRLCWMSPDELLLLCPRAEIEDSAARLTAALTGQHALVVNLSDARSSFSVSGVHARDVIAKLCPVDLSLDAFREGDFRRTRMAQVPAAFWMTGPETFRIVCFRSHARYVFDLLTVAAQPGSEVHLHAKPS